MLGIVQALLLVGCLIVILDSFFLIPGDRPESTASSRSCGASSTSTNTSATASCSGAAHPGLHQHLRDPHPGRHPERSTSHAADDASRRSTLGPVAVVTAISGARPADARGRAAGCSARGWFATTPTRPARRPDRRGRGVHRRGRPCLACPVRANEPQRGHVRVSRHRLRVPCLRDVRLPEHRHRARRTARGDPRPGRRAARGRRTLMRGAARVVAGDRSGGGRCRRDARGGAASGGARTTADLGSRARARRGRVRDLDRSLTGLDLLDPGVAAPHRAAPGRRPGAGRRREPAGRDRLRGRALDLRSVAVRRSRRSPSVSAWPAPGRRPTRR